MTSSEDGPPGAASNNGHAYFSDGDDRSSVSSDDDTQAGVKNIEAISQTWSKWALVSAYVGFVILFCPQSRNLDCTRLMWS